MVRRGVIQKNVVSLNLTLSPLPQCIELAVLAQQRVLKLIFIESHYTILKFFSLKSLSPDVLSEKMTLLLWKFAWSILFDCKCGKVYNLLGLLLTFIVLSVQLLLLNETKYILFNFLIKQFYSIFILSKCPQATILIIFYNNFGRGVALWCYFRGSISRKSRSFLQLMH